MKKVISVLMIIVLAITGCIKEFPGTDIGLEDKFKSDDNSKGGGGDNISFSAVPAAVQTSFTKLFPDAARSEWKKLSNGNYKVQFYRSGVKWEVTFNSAGVVVKQERE